MQDKQSEQDRCASAVTGIPSFMVTLFIEFEVSEELHP